MSRVRRNLTLDTYHKLMADFHTRAKADLEPQQSKADRQFAALYRLGRPKKGDEAEVAEAHRRLKPILGATVSHSGAGYPIVEQIVKDFGNRRGLNVFGFGVGYGQLLFFLKKHFNAKTKGVDLGTFSKSFTEAQKLGVIHGKSVDDPTLRKLGKFDITYSILVFESDILTRRENVRGMLDNMASMTRKGGKSYHLIGMGHIPISDREIEARGFKISNKTTLEGGNVLLTLTKIRD